ncbi:MAG: chorismate synthase [Alphaproteobacteria bacterium]|uniref:Chorismate synthase n=1 Tax=Candidatus Nitrobium versatile TaxID=2884831 RepID=A0A953J3Q4_9BACT|nr:chorismate synthase [Candidatus Nitrobium versatile]
MLRFLTAGESHGKGLVGIVEGIPAGLALSPDDIDRELKRRQGGYGRGGRMKIEQDHAEILSGVRWGKTMGSPLSLLIENRDWKNWQEGMSPDVVHEGSIPPVTRPRPGHADLAGAVKYGQKDVRNILERSSARETAMRVAVGAVAKRFLAEFGITIGSYVIRIGNAVMQRPDYGMQETLDWNELLRKTEASPVRCPEEEASKQMTEAIDAAAKNGDTLGGTFEVIATGVPAGLGSHIQWDKRLDGRLAQALMGTQAMKGVEIGTGFAMAEKPGSEVMDEIYYHKETDSEGKASADGSCCSFYRKTNHAGGIEGGMTNGMPVVVRAAMKPIPTLRRPLRSVDIVSREPLEAAYERSDTCAVPAAAVIGEAMMAVVLSDAFLEKFGGNTVDETRRNYDAYREYLRGF